MAGRASRPPARHWADSPHIVAGLDEEAGGTWLGLNDDGLMAGVLNRHGSLGPAKGKRSRGELPLEALSHAEAAEAAKALSHLDGLAYRSFNMVVADVRDAYWIRSTGETSRIEVAEVPMGTSMVTAYDLNDTSTPRIAGYLPKFQSATVPDPDTEAWSAWTDLLVSRDALPGAGAKGAMTVGDGSGFGTVSSSLIALPGPARFGAKPIWRYANGAPDRTPYDAVDLS